jgi:hypothetical protein
MGLLYALKRFTFPAFGAAGGLLALAVYGIATVLLRVEEASLLWDTAIRRMRRN